MKRPDELDQYLQGDSALSRLYRREATIQPPPSVDRAVIDRAGETAGPVHGARQRPNSRASWLAPLAFAASVLLSVALVAAIILPPEGPKRDYTPRVLRTALRLESPARPHPLYSTDPPGRHNRAGTMDPRAVQEPEGWLADIAALRRAGRDDEADAELRRFRGAYPSYVIRDSTLSGNPRIRP